MRGIRIRGLFTLLILVFALAAPDLAAQAVARYRVTFAPGTTEDRAVLARQLAATYGGRLEMWAEEGFDGFVVMLRPEQAQLLSRSGRVAAVEPLVSHEIVAPQPAQPAQPAAQPVVQPAAQAEAPPSAGTAAPQPRPQRQVAADDVNSVWSTGAYRYDAAGNVVAMGEDYFVYDLLSRITKGTAGAGKRQQYEYDSFGNVKKVTTDNEWPPLTIGVDPQTNKMTRTGTAYNVFAQYDNAGNMVTYVWTDTFTYDGLNVVKESNVGGARTLYVYSANDERIAAVSVVNNAPAFYRWTVRDTREKVLREYNDSVSGSVHNWSWKEDYIYRGSQLLAADLAGPPHRLHFHIDHLGTPRLITGNGGAKISLHTYYPFGREATLAAQDTERMKFTGHERDAANLDYMHARYYLPFIGRFLSTDPVPGEPGIPQSWNRYAYTRNNPLTIVDVTGLVDNQRGGCESRPEGCGSQAQRQQNAQKRYVIIVGEPGLAPHNAGNLFERAAATLKKKLEAQGHIVTIVRAGTVQTFGSALTTGPTITGDAIYMGHSSYNALHPGEESGADTNVDASNIGQLSSRNMAPNARLILMSCWAADGGTESIAWQLSNQLKREVLGSEEDFAFSHAENVFPDYEKARPGDVYMVPRGNSWRWYRAPGTPPR